MHPLCRDAPTPSEAVRVVFARAVLLEWGSGLFFRCVAGWGGVLQAVQPDCVLAMGLDLLFGGLVRSGTSGGNLHLRRFSPPAT